MDPNGCVAGKKINLSERVKLNVGGHIFQTTLATLVSRDGMLKNMFESDLEIKKDSDESVFIDRDGKYFSEILNFLRRDFIPLSRTKAELENILAEAKFYQIEPLVKTLEDEISGLDREAKNSDDHQNIEIIIMAFRHGQYEVSTIVQKDFNQPVVCLYIGEEDDRAGVELERLLDVSKIYSDVYRFILHLSDSKRDYDEMGPKWFLFKNGSGVLITKAMQSSPRYALLELVAQSIRRREANNQSPN